MSKRVTYRILPRGVGWGCKVSGEWIVVDNCAQMMTKADYVRAVKALARGYWKHYGIISEVVIHVRGDGRLGRGARIGKGKGSKTTYGRDPRKSKG